MRVSREAMAHHRTEIVAAAAKMLRQRGIDRTSVADLMQAAGLTHGGFYRHFASKDDLVAEATTHAFGGLFERFDKRVGEQDARKALLAYVDNYLSHGHLAQPEAGCPIAAYGTDVSREGAAVRAAFERGISGQLDRIAAGLACRPALRRSRAVEILSLMVGAVVAARATGDKALSGELLTIARKRVIDLIDQAA